MKLGFGQPERGIIQICFTVPDIEAAIRSWLEGPKVGPWFLLPRWTPERATYRGGPSEAEVAIAMAFNGQTLIELIQPLDDKPSVYKEAIDKCGHGFHHVGIAAPAYDEQMADYRARGVPLAFEAWVPTGVRVGYLDTRDTIGAFSELIEMDAVTNATFTGFYQAARDWDGSDPIRPFAPVG